MVSGASDMVETMRPEQEKELMDMYVAVDNFAIAMKNKLERKALEGYHGGLNVKNRGEVYRRLVEHVGREQLAAHQEVDIANLAMMLWQTRQDEAVERWSDGK